MNKEEIENYIAELESMFELSELEEHSRNILKVGNYIKQLQQENQELKKQLEEKENIACDWKDSCLENAGKIEILETQQKEFIEYLEDEIQQQETVIAENQEKSYFLIYEDEKEDLKLSSQKAYIRRMILEEILQKYRSIIGGK